MRCPTKLVQIRRHKHLTADRTRVPRSAFPCAWDDMTVVIVAKRRV